MIHSFPFAVTDCQHDLRLRRENWVLLARGERFSIARLWDES
jgi:hypothetical protein